MKEKYIKEINDENITIEIVRELTVVRRNEITSEQVFSQAKEGSMHQDSQKFECNQRKNKDFTMVKIYGKHKSSNSNTKKYTNKNTETANTTVPCLRPTVFCYIGETAQGVDELTTLREYAGM